MTPDPMNAIGELDIDALEKVALERLPMAVDADEFRARCQAFERAFDPPTALKLIALARSSPQVNGEVVEDVVRAAYRAGYQDGYVDGAHPEGVEDEAGVHRQIDNVAMEDGWANNRDHLLAALSSKGIGGCGEWRPIETAPRDGTPFLAFTPDDTFSSITGIEVMWFDSQLGLVFGPDCSEPVFAPTLWQPLPPPPLSAAPPLSEQEGAEDHGAAHP